SKSQDTLNQNLRPSSRRISSLQPLWRSIPQAAFRAASGRSTAEDGVDAALAPRPVRQDLLDLGPPVPLAGHANHLVNLLLDSIGERLAGHHAAHVHLDPQAPPAQESCKFKQAGLVPFVCDEKN